MARMAECSNVWPDWRARNLASMGALIEDRRYVERQLTEADGSPWGTARLMWQNRLAEIDRQIAALAAERAQ